MYYIYAQVNIIHPIKIIYVVVNVDCTIDAEEPIKGSDSIHKLTSFDALDVEEPLTGSDSNYTDRKLALLFSTMCLKDCTIYV